MADNRIDVVFGARLNELAAGVRAAQAHIDGLRAPVQGLIGSLGSIAKVVGVAFAVNKIADWAAEMAKLGEETLNSAYALGLTVQKYTEFNEALAITGAEGAQRVLQRLALQIHEARQGSESAIEAFRGVGISMKEVNANGDDLIDFFLLLLRRVNELPEGFDRAGRAQAALGRGTERLAGALREGEAGFLLLMQATEDYSKTNARAVAGMAETDDKIDLLTLHLKTLGIEGFRSLKEPIDDIVAALDAMVRAGIAVIRFLNDLSYNIARAGAEHRKFLHGLTGGWVPRFEGDDALIEGGDRLQRIFETEGASSPPRKPPPPRKTGKDGGGSDTRMAEWHDEWRQKLQDEQKFFDDSKAKELAYWQDKLATVSTGGEKDVKLRREVNAQIFQLQKDLAKETQSLAIDHQTYLGRTAEERFSRQRQLVQGAVALDRISASEGVALERGFLDQKWALDSAYYEKKLQAAINDVDESSRLQREEFLAHQQYLSDREALDISAALATKQAWEDIVSPVKSAISSAATGVAQGTQTIGEAIQNIEASIGAAVISKISDTLFDRLGDVFTSVLPDTLKSVLGLGEVAASGAALTGSATALGTSALALQSAAVALSASAATSAAADTGSSLLSGLPVIGPLSSLFSGGSAGAAAGAAGGGDALLTIFETAGAAAGLLAFARGGIVPSARSGWAVPQFNGGGVLAQLHSREMVLPANISEGLQSMIANGGGGGPPVVINVSAVDSRGVKQFFLGNANLVAEAVNRGQRLGTAPRLA